MNSRPPNYSQKLKTGDQRHQNSNYQNRPGNFNATQNTSAKPMHINSNTHLSNQPQNFLTIHQHQHMSIPPMNNQQQNFAGQMRTTHNTRPQNVRSFQSRNPTVVYQNQMEPPMVYQTNYPAYFCSSNLMPQFPPFSYTPNIMMPHQIPAGMQNQIQSSIIQPPRIMPQTSLNQPTSIPNDVITSPVEAINTIKIQQQQNQPSNVPPQTQQIAGVYTPQPQQTNQQRQKKVAKIQHPDTGEDINIASLAEQPITGKTTTNTTKSIAAKNTTLESKQINVIVDNNEQTANKKAFPEFDQQSVKNLNEASQITTNKSPSTNVSSPITVVVKQENVSPVSDNKTSPTNELVDQKEKPKDDNEMSNIVEKKVADEEPQKQETPNQKITSSVVQQPAQQSIQPPQPTQPATDLVKSQSQSSVNKLQTTVSKSANEEPKKSNLENPQSKSASKKPLTYDINELKELQDCGFSFQKPDFGNLNGKVEIFLNKPRSKQETQFVLSMGDFDPHYMRSSNSMHGRFSNSMQMGQRLNSDNKVPRKIISSSLNKEVKLRQSDNAWKPGIKNSNDEATDSLIKKARGMLNKLTPQNFEKLSKQFIDLEINTPEKLRKMIELIFDKAVDEPAFCEQYALLCKNMCSITVCDENNDKIKFNTLLLERCQNCFETDMYKDINIKERQEEIEKCDDEEKKKQLIDELDEAKRNVRKKSLGNIKLIGALYKNKKLKDEIMQLCINTLIAINDDDSYECLCSLLKSIGENFEKNLQNKQNFNKQMNQLEQVVKENKITSRIKFLIMDVLDMRREGWKPRKLQDVNKPKTIEEVHEEVKKQEEQSNREISQLSKRNDSTKKRIEWLGSSMRKSQQSGSDAILNIRKLNEQRNTSQNSQPLAPLSFNLGPNNWSQGALGARQSLTSSASDRKNVNQLQIRSNNSNSSKLDQSSKVASTNKKIRFRGVYTPGNESKNFEMLEKYLKIIKEYIDSSELDNCIESICEISTENSTNLFVVSAIENACESLLKHIEVIGELLSKLVIVEKIISHQQFLKGLKHHLSASQDVITDVPKLFEYIGKILSHFYLKISDEERRSFFKDALEPCLEFDTSIKILAYLIKNTIKIAEDDHSEVAKKWLVSKMSFEDFSIRKKEEEIKDLLRKEYNLDKFLLALNNCKVPSENSVKVSNLCSKILSGDFEELPELVKKELNLNDKEKNTKLICALFERCISESIDDNKFKIDLFEKKIKAFPPFKELETEVALEVIYTVVKINSELLNPKDLLINIFNYLCDKYITIAAFKRWAKDNKDCTGNSIAILASKRFLKELCDDSEE